MLWFQCVISQGIWKKKDDLISTQEITTKNWNKEMTWFDSFYLWLSSQKFFGISNNSLSKLSWNSNFWKVIFAETVGKIGISILTGKPPGSLSVTNSRSLVKCLKGAITSKTFNNISTVNGKSLLWNRADSFFFKKKLCHLTGLLKLTIATVARNVLLDSL